MDNQHPLRAVVNVDLWLGFSFIPLYLFYFVFLFLIVLIPISLPSFILLGPRAIWMLEGAYRVCRACVCSLWPGPTGTHSTYLAPLPLPFWPHSLSGTPSLYLSMNKEAGERASLARLCTSSGAFVRPRARAREEERWTIVVLCLPDYSCAWPSYFFGQ